MPTSRPVRRRPAVVALLCAVALVLAACTGGGDDDEPVDVAALQQRLDTAKAAIDAAETIEFSLGTESVPDGVSGLLSAKGQGNHDPAFQGDVSVSTGGATISAEVVAVDGKVYAKTGVTPIFLTIDPATLKAPDPAGLMDPDTGVTQILASTEDLDEGDRSRDGEDVLTTVTGTLPGSVVAEIIPSAAQEATFDVSYRLTDDDELRDAVISGPFYGGTQDVRYTVRLGISDDPVEITAPTRGGGS